MISSFAVFYRYVSVFPPRSVKTREFEKLWRENVRAHLGPFHLNWPEPVLSGRPERTDATRPKSIPANRPDFIAAVPIFDFQNLQKSGRPEFLEFHPLNISIFEVMFKTRIGIFPGLFFCKLRRNFLYRSELFV